MSRREHYLIVQDITGADLVFAVSRAHKAMGRRNPIPKFCLIVEMVASQFLSSRDLPPPPYS